MSVQDKIKFFNGQRTEEKKQQPNPREKPEYNFKSSGMLDKLNKTTKKELIKLEEKGDLTIYEYPNINFSISDLKYY